MAYLEVHGIKKVYPTGEEALKGVEFEMSAQEVVAVSYTHLTLPTKA